MKKLKNKSTENLLEIESKERLSSAKINKLSNEHQLLDTYLKSSIENNFSELLFRLTNEKFEETKANVLWESILTHKDKLNKKLKRDVGILVATLDYLTNITNEIISPKITKDQNIEIAAKMATTDPMTGLYSKMIFNISLETEIIKSIRYKRPLSLIILDIDNFKQVNDTYGHQAGDKVIIELAEIGTKCLRKADLFARYGGEEFAVIMPETNSEKAFIVSERIRKNVIKFLKIKNSIITVSIGISSLSTVINSSYELIKHADDALYKAKKEGKNCSRISST
ncbi:MAG: GGDEF domain-containing protein [Fibrobacteria bacterium]|nr:GGDEF domain-containing protein [Fibrobacteria bacterium]